MLQKAFKGVCLSKKKKIFDWYKKIKHDRESAVDRDYNPEAKF